MAVRYEVKKVMKKCVGLMLVVMGLVAIAVLSGCDGSNGSLPPPTGNTGSVSGRVVAGVDNPVGFGNVLIIIGGRQALSNANGFFQVTNIPPGTYEVEVIVNPDTGFVVPPDADPIEVTVLAGQNTALANDIVVVDENDLPPPPPG